MIKSKLFGTRSRSPRIAVTDPRPEPPSPHTGGPDDGGCIGSLKLIDKVEAPGQRPNKGPSAQIGRLEQNVEGPVGPAPTCRSVQAEGSGPKRSSWAPMGPWALGPSIQAVGPGLIDPGRKQASKPWPFKKTSSAQGPLRYALRGFPRKQAGPRDKRDPTLNNPRTKENCHKHIPGSQRKQ